MRFTWRDLEVIGRQSTAPTGGQRNRCGNEGIGASVEPREKRSRIFSPRGLRSRMSENVPFDIIGPSSAREFRHHCFRFASRLFITTQNCERFHDNPVSLGSIGTIGISGEIFSSSQQGRRGIFIEQFLQFLDRQWFIRHGRFDWFCYGNRRNGIGFCLSRNARGLGIRHCRRGRRFRCGRIVWQSSSRMRIRRVFCSNPSNSSDCWKRKTNDPPLVHVPIHFRFGTISRVMVCGSE